MISRVSCRRPQRGCLPQACHHSTSSHDAQVEARQTAHSAELCTDREPAQWDDQVAPPSLIEILLLLSAGTDALVPSLGPLVAFQLRLTRQADKVAAEARHPSSVRPQIDLARRPARLRGPARSVRCWEDRLIRQQSDVLKELERHVQRALRDRCRVENFVLTGLGSLKELAHPGIHWEQAKEAQNGASLGQKRAEIGNAGLRCNGSLEHASRRTTG